MKIKVNCRKVLTIVLSLSMLISVSPNIARGFDNSISSAIHIDVTNNATYISNDDYSLVVGVYDGTLDVAYKPHENTLYYGIYNLADISLSTENSYDSIFTNIETMIENEKLEFDHVTYPNSYEETGSITRANSNDIQKIYAAIRKDYGSEYYDKFLGSLNAEYSAFLYENKTIGADQDFSLKAVLGLSLTAISAMISLPATVIGTIVTVGTNAAGVAIALSDLFEYNGYVYYRKYVNVEDEKYVYNTYKTIYLTAFVGDKGAALKEKKTTAYESYSWTNRRVMEEGIKIYIDQYT